MLASVSLVVLLGTGAAACGGGSTSQTPAQKKAAITTTWTTFFNASTPASQQVALLQNGTAHKTQIDQLRGKLPPGTMAQVKSITLSGNTATVHYEATAHGTVLVANATGTAVDVNGKWLVSQTTFCGLVALAGAHC